MKNINTAFFLLVLAGSANAKEYVIDDYELTWHVATVGKIALSLVKEEDSLKATLTRNDDFSSSYLTFAPKDLARLSPVLKRTDEFYSKQKGKGKVKEEVRVGDNIVVFSSSQDSGFSVIVLKNRGIVVDSISMDRKEAIGLTAELDDIVAKSAYLTSKVSF
jgi:hypothetical protein